MVEGALQTLHGFDMIHPSENRNLVRYGGHDESRPSYHSDRHVESELDRWLAKLAVYDDDPEESRRRAHAFARRYIEEEAVATRRAADSPPLAELPEKVRATALGLARGEVMWSRGDAHAAITGLAASGALILGLDLRSDGPGGSHDPNVATEIPWTVCRSGAIAEAAREAHAGVEAAWDDYPDHPWMLITWSRDSPPSTAGARSRTTELADPAREASGCSPRATACNGRPRRQPVAPRRSAGRVVPTGRCWRPRPSICHGRQAVDHGLWR